VDRSQYRSIISRVWQAWHSSLWQQAELDYIGNIEALENERLVLNHELHSTKAADKAALEAAALQFEALLASQGEECSCRLRFITGACVHIPEHIPDTLGCLFSGVCACLNRVFQSLPTHACVYCAIRRAGMKKSAGHALEVWAAGGAEIAFLSTVDHQTIVLPTQARDKHAHTWKT
jgi:hypothetical protein